MNFKLLTEQHLEVLKLTGGCTGPSESTLVKMSQCWNSHAMAQIYCCTGPSESTLVKMSQCWKSHAMAQIYLNSMLRLVVRNPLSLFDGVCPFLRKHC